MEVVSELDLDIPNKRVDGRHPDLRIVIGGESLPDPSDWDFISAYTTPEGLPIYRISRIPKGFLFSFPGRTAIEVGANRLSVDCNLSPATNPVPYLLAKPLSMAMELSGRVVVHATSCAVNHRVVALLGHATAGKTTFSLALQERGHPILTDDVVVLDANDPELNVQAGPAITKAWPDTCRQFLAQENCERRVTPNTDKRWLIRSPKYDLKASYPLVLIVILNRIQEPVTPKFERLAPGRALAALIATTHIAEFEMLLPQRGQRMKVLASIAERCAVMELTYPTGFDHLAACCELIESWIARHGR